MIMSDDRTIREVLGRMADEAPPALDLEDLEDPVVTRSARGRSATPPNRRTLAAVAGSAVVVLAVLAIIFSSGSTVDEVTLVGEPVAATAADYDAVLAASLEELSAAPGVEALERGFIAGYLSNVSWASTRSNGDTVVVQQADVDVRDTAWWVASSSPPRVGENIETIARVLVGDSFYEATDSESWTIADRTEAPRGPGSFALGLLRPDFRSDYQRMMAAPVGSEVTRQDTADGGEVWVVTYEVDDSPVRGRLRIHADGYLAELSLQSEDLDTNPVDFGPPIDLALTSYRVLDDPDSIPVPEAGTPLDLDDFDLPEGFGVGR